MACMRRALLMLFVAAAVVALSSTPAAAILDAEKTVFTSFNIPNDTSGKPVSSGVRGEEVRGGARAAGLERAREKRMGSRVFCVVGARVLVTLRVPSQAGARAWPRPPMPALA